MRPARSLPYPLDDPHCRLYGLGRTALWHGLRTLGLGVGDEVLVPAYHHGSEVGVFEAAGIECRFYDATQRLVPDEAELEALLGERTRALLVIHYLGFPQNAPHWRRWCDQRGLVLIEDVAMAWLAKLEGRPLGSWGQIAFYSPWKTHGLPEDCGALVYEASPGGAPAGAVSPAAPPVMPARGIHARGLAKSAAKWPAQRSGLLARLLPAGGGFDASREFAVGDTEAGPSASALFLLRRLCRIDAAAARRRNHSRLLELLGERVPPPFDRTPEESCPFAFPIVSEDKLGLMHHLSQLGVRALNMWAVPHPLLPVDDFPEAAYRRRVTVGLPVHQELRPDDLERIAAAVVDYERAPRHGPVDSGDVAPDFELADQDGGRARLSEFAGRAVILYFYPEAETPGCTAQACGMRDRHAALGGANAVVLGVSPDPPEKLRAFADNHGLPFTLLSDPQGRTAQRYGVWVRRPGLLPRHENERTTFVIDAEGVVQRVLRAVDPALHDELVLRELGAGVVQRF
jgi:peroxiredoxin/dTDP-4-amino-4,6-dideoxygalactose transaminase